MDMSGGYYVLRHDTAAFYGYIPFPFYVKNTNYILDIESAFQDNVGNVTEQISVGYKDNVGFQVSIPGTYDYSRCGLRIIYKITFA